MNETTIQVLLDTTAERVPFNKRSFAIKLDKGELFKYAVWMLEVPSHVKESDFDYLQSKVPSLEGLYSDYIEFTADSIVNLCTDDRTKQLISEMIGIGVGLKYSTLLLSINPNQFKKIGVPVEGKYLDYAVVKDAKEYEIETKGTISDYYSAMKNDIIAKKAAQGRAIHLRFGTIMMLVKDTAGSVSKCVIVDDPPTDVPAPEVDVYEIALLYYAMYLSFILDSKYYNKFIRPLKRGRNNSVRIQQNKFFAKYYFQNRTYYGECFDYRLIRENVSFVESNSDTDDIFRQITERVGRIKFFLGVESTVIEAINNANKDLLLAYHSPKTFTQSDGVYKCLDTDGILIIKSQNGHDQQLEQVFSEDVVKERLGLYDRYLKGEAHLCGAPCTSPGIEGKPCERRTFRRNCFFHR
ncbi:hypothetical protein [Mucilaginibacter glaciei]|uniref:Uncharacterized protein n=1 Tax=Mucilaginibacter glaciei TaxID=2772109 RepID=A0A926NPV8_9SPHI|nr:hypothetical protein [Mucilaginibacter glaciei]MBD1395136.1 hypothetical protein [Mucilaginibacter glaciei]